MKSPDGLYEEAQYQFAVSRALYNNAGLNRFQLMRAKYHLMKGSRLMFKLAKRMNYSTTMFHTNNH